MLSLWSNSFLQSFFVTEFASFNLTLTARLQPNFIVVAATFVLCLIATLLFSLGPALRAARADLVHDLKGQGGEAAVAGRWNQFFSGRHLMVMGQIALCLVMLFSAGLFVRAAVKEGDLGAATGFTTDGVVITELDFSLARTSEPEVMRRAVGGDRTVAPFAGSAGSGADQPRALQQQHHDDSPSSGGGSPTRATIPASPAPGNGRNSSSISTGYFDSIGVRILRGRDFTETEARMAGANRVCIVDQGMAEKLFPGEDALGRRVRLAEPTAKGASGDMEIVGIVNRHAHGMEDRSKPAPNVFVPLAQEFHPILFLTVRSAHAGSRRAFAGDRELSPRVE